MIIEKIDRSGHVIDVYSFRDNQIFVGRGYSNDLILHDIYSDDRHVKIEFDYLHDAFIVTDLNSLNGVALLDGKKTLPIETEHTDGGDVIRAKSGDTITVGKTRLRLLKKDHPIMPAKLLSSLDAILSNVGTWWFFGIVITMLLASEAFSAYITDPFAKRLVKDMAQSLYIIFVAIGYGGVWVLVARTQRLDGRFLMHVNILLLASVLAGLYQFIEPIIEFNMEWLVYRGYFTKVLICAGVFAAIYSSCYQSTNLSTVKRVAISLLLPAFVLLGIVVSELNRFEFQMRPPYNMTLVSPAWQWQSSINESEFISETDALYLPPEKEE